MANDIDVLNKALNDTLKKSQHNFVNGDGKDDQGTIQSNPVNNENGSISRTQGASGDGNDPTNSSNLQHTNPEGQAGNGIHAQGSKNTKTGNGLNSKDAVSTSPDDTNQYDKEAKSEKSYDRTSKDKNGVREVHNPVKNSTRNLGDKPNANANAEQHIAQTASGTKHNDAEISASIDKLVNLTKNIVHAISVHSGDINALKSQFNSGFQNLNSRIDKTNKNINKPKTVKDTINKSDEAKAIALNDGKQDDKHMANNQIRGMFGHAEHEHGKKKTHAMAEADNAVTRCHNSHKSLTDDQWKNIESKAYVEAAKSIINQVGDSNLAKSLDSKLEHDAETGNKQALAKDNYKYDQSEKAAHAHKSVNTGSTAAKSTKHSLANLMSLAASYKNDGNDSAVASCDSMCNAMKKGKAAKSEAADLFKNVSNVDHNSKADLSSMSANSSQKPNSRSDDIDHSTKSINTNNEVHKRMPYGKAQNATTNKSMNKANNSKNNNSVNKSMQHEVLSPSQVKARGNNFVEWFKTGETPVNKSIVGHAINVAKNAHTSSDLDRALNIYKQR